MVPDQACCFLIAAAADCWLFVFCPPSGDLFFTDWSDMDMNIRMKYWDRKFKTLLSYPQVGGCWCV